MTRMALATAVAALVLPAASNAVDKPPAGTPANETAARMSPASNWSQVSSPLTV